MPFPPEKKKPGLDVMIAVGKPKPGLGSMTPVERKGKPPMDQQDEEQGEPDNAHEAAESPQEEGTEEYGAKLINDIKEVGSRYGADESTTMSMAADFFDAMAKCLRGDKGDAGNDQSATGDTGDTGDMSAGAGQY